MLCRHYGTTNQRYVSGADIDFPSAHSQPGMPHSQDSGCLVVSRTFGLFISVALRGKGGITSPSCQN